MIQPAELRRGNIVAFKNGVGRITRLNITAAEAIMQNNFYQTEYYKHLEPVLLTTEILEKCGFVSDFAKVAGHDRNITFYSKGEFYITRPENSEHFEQEYLQGRNTVVASLHQIQNLYFSLTGEELKIIL